MQEERQKRAGDNAPPRPIKTKRFRASIFKRFKRDRALRHASSVDTTLDSEEGKAALPHSRPVDLRVHPRAIAFPTQPVNLSRFESPLRSVSFFSDDSARSPADVSSPLEEQSDLHLTSTPRADLERIVEDVPQDELGRKFHFRFVPKVAAKARLTMGTVVEDSADAQMKTEESVKLQGQALGAAPISVGQVGLSTSGQPTFMPLSMLRANMGGKVPIEQQLEYTRLVGMINPKEATAGELDWLADYLSTMTLIQQDKLAESNSLAKVDEAIKHLPRTSATTIKLNELVVRPEVFDGVKPKPRKWIQEYNEAIIANGWSDRIAIKYFPTYLAKSAKDWYIVDVQPFLTPEAKWHQVYTHFMNNYLTSADYESLSQAIENARQRPDESVSNYIPRLRRLMLLLTPGLPEQEQLRQLKNKLRPEYKQLMALTDPSCIKELRTCCLKIEAGFAAKAEPRKESKPPRGHVSSTDRPEARRQAPRLGGRRFRRRTFGNQTKGSSDPIRTRRPDGRASGESVSREEVKCFNCGRLGHYANRCPSKSESPRGHQRRAVHLVQAEEDMEVPTEVLTISTKGPSARAGNKARYSVRPVDEGSINLLVGGGKLLKQQLVVNSVDLTAVVDTGAYVSVIDEELVKHFGWRIKGQGAALVGADGNRLGCLGVTCLEIRITIRNVTKVKVHPVQVVRNLTAPMLLGLELMKEFEILIDTPNGELRFISGKSKKGVRLAKDEEIPARSRMVVSTQVQAVGLVLIKPFTLESGLLVANSIDRIQGGQVPALVLNPFDKPSRLTKGTQIASYELLEDDQFSASAIRKLEQPVNLMIDVGSFEEQVCVGENLNVQQRDQLTLLLSEFREAFSLKGEIGSTNVCEHQIELLPGAKPVVEPLRRRALVQIEETRRQVRELLEAGIIEDSDSPWASAYVLAKKKNGEFRLCIDFRRLNDMTKKVAYPLPNIDECLETLSGKRYFSQLDFCSGFWQIPLEDKAKELTAFRTEEGQYHFKRMPFGLCNAPGTFQKTINTVLAGLKGPDLQVFIDDVCIATRSWQEHLCMLEKTLKVIIRSNMKLKMKKCVFAAEAIKFLGHEISSAGIKQDPDKLSALTKMPEPNDAKAVKRALGMFSYYRKFVPRFAILAEPLTRLTKKLVPFEWGNEQRESYRAILHALASNATLSHFTHTDPVRVKTDASHQGVAGMLLQFKDNEWRLITCCSRRLTKSEANYGITDLEGLAVIYTVNKLRPYLLGKKFSIIVDHCALCVLNKRTPSSARLRRWAIVLSEFDFTIEYTKGNLHCDVDCLSRNPVDEPVDAYLEGRVYLVSPNEREAWVELLKDAECEAVVAQAEKREEGYELIEGVVYKGGLLYVPPKKRREIVEEVHKSPTNAHPGIRATIAKLKENYYWENMRSEVERVVNACLTCLEQKPDRQQPKGEMNSFQIYTPGEQVAVDLIENITESKNGNRFIIVAIDMFTRYVDAKAVPTKDSVEFTQFLVEYCGRFGVPHSLLTDKSATFCNELTGQLMTVFGVTHVRSTPYHSQGNAVVERVNQTLEEKIRLIIDDPVQKDSWDQVLPLALLSINTTHHVSIGCTPYEMTFGRRAPLQDRTLDPAPQVHDQFARYLKTYMDSCHSNAIAVQAASREQALKYFEQRHRRVLFDVGDEVLIRSPSRSAKLHSKFIGPYKIIAIHKDIYSLRNLENRKIIQRHVADIRPLPSNPEDE